VARYDATVIEKYARRLYGRADYILVVYTCLGLGIGALLGYLPEIVWYWKTTESPAPGHASALVLAPVLGLLFGMMGRAKGNSYRLQAQLALCQVQIEYNTRNAAEKPMRNTAAA